MWIRQFLVFRTFLLTCVFIQCFSAIVRYEFKCPPDPDNDGSCLKKRYPKYASCDSYWQCMEDCSRMEHSCGEDPGGEKFSYYDQECQSANEDKCKEFVFHCAQNNTETMLLQCPSELVIGIRRATVGISAHGCHSNQTCCLPGGNHVGGCRVWVPSKDPRLFEIKKRCDGHVQCDAGMIQYVDCADPSNNSSLSTVRTSLDFQLLFFSCIKSRGSVASACIQNNPELHMNLRCSRSTLIQIVRVVVGVRDNLTCPDHQCCPQNPKQLHEMDGSSPKSCLSDIIFWCDGLRECYGTGPIGQKCAPFENIDFQYAFYECIPENLIVVDKTNKTSRSKQVHLQVVNDKASFALPVSIITAGLLLLMASIVVPIVFYSAREKVILKSQMFPNQEEPSYVTPDVGFTHEESDGFEYDETPVTWNSLAYTADIEEFDGSVNSEPMRMVEMIMEKFSFKNKSHEYQDFPLTSEVDQRPVIEQQVLEKMSFMTSWSSLAHTEIENMEHGEDDLESLDYDTCSLQSDSDQPSSNESMAQRL